MAAPCVEVCGLTFTYPGIDGHPPPNALPLIEDLTLSLNAGDRCLLVGANGAGRHEAFVVSCPTSYIA